MEILHQFGFDLKLFVGQIINFLILVYVFKRFMYQPILNVLKERQDRIRKGLEDSEQAKAALDQAHLDSAEILKSTRKEAQEIIDHSRQFAERMKDEILTQSKAESERIIAQARAQAEQERERMEKNIRVMSVELSQKILSGVIQSLFTPEEKQRILKKAVQEIEKNNEALQ